MRMSACSTFWYETRPRQSMVATVSESAAPEATSTARIVASEPALSASRASTTLGVKRLMSCICASVMAVPIDAATLAMPAWWQAITSM